MFSYDAARAARDRAYRRRWLFAARFGPIGLLAAPMLARVLLMNSWPDRLATFLAFAAFAATILAFRRAGRVIDATAVGAEYAAAWIALLAPFLIAAVIPPGTLPQPLAPVVEAMRWLSPAIGGVYLAMVAAPLLDLALRRELAVLDADDGLR